MPRPTMHTAQTRPQMTVSRLRFFSTTEEPASDEDTAPPNIEDRPPPLPRCSRISTTSMRLLITSSTFRTTSTMRREYPTPTEGRPRSACAPRSCQRTRPPVLSADAGGGEVVAAVRLHHQPVAQPLPGDQLDAVLGQRHVGGGRARGGRHVPPGVERR